ncbi:MAG: T9SS type A sorting domain-containing protein [Paludibacteraceae bacterium]|nr:T9SS type A sorting domain-containing protein [Paludibacteraceae bacterium]MBP7679839.1 T9SS type A sorting domain-containing protein [Saprospiraceae bacterium]
MVHAQVGQVRFNEPNDNFHFLEVGKATDFVAEFLPTGIGQGNSFEITKIIWESETGGFGPTVSGKINGQIGELITIDNPSPTNPISSASIVIGDGHNIDDNIETKVTFEWDLIFSDGSRSSRTTVQPKLLPINRIFEPVFPSTAIPKCCNLPTTFSVTNYGKANSFEWQVSGATYTAAGPTITITPNNLNSMGSIWVTCKVSRAEAATAYQYSRTLEIFRTNPVLVKDPANFKQNNLCQNSTYTYKVRPLCGATNYNWIFPSGWTVQAGQGSQIVTVSTNASASSGNVTINTTLDGGCTTTATYPLTIITTVPHAPQVSLTEDYDTGFQCGQWQICPNGTTVYLVPQSITEAYTYQVTNPWRVNGLLSVTTSDPFVTISYVGDAPSSGVLTFRAINCVGPSAWNNYTFSRQMSYWCTHSYPIWCECCEPPCNGCPPRQLYEAPPEGESQVVKEYSQSTNNSPVASSSLDNNIVDKLLLQPNPAENEVAITLPNTTSGIGELVSMNGEILGSFDFKNTNTFILPLKEITSGGMYLLRVTTSEAILTEKLLITR